MPCFSPISRAETARPGDTVLAGIQLHMDPQWHTYWKNSGASGIPTSVKWDLPAGITAGDIQWPVPEKLPPDDLTTYIFQNDVVLLVPLKLAPDLQPGPRELKATVSWLECKEQCVPGKADVTSSLTIGAESKPSQNLDLIQSWQKKLPQPGNELSAHAWWEKGTNEDTRPLTLEWSSPAAAGEADFYPLAGDQFEVQGATERLPADAGKIRVRKQVKKFQGDWPNQISGLLIQKSGDRQLAYEASLPISSMSGETTPTGMTTSDAEPAAAALAQPLWKMLLYAILGGLILNVMPCVLPVIALKILGFVREAQNDPRHVRALGLVYALGVLVSFLALAGLVIGVKAAGHRAGWGMQFSSPQFVVVLIVLVTLVALNLFGLFEVNPGGRALSAAGSLASRQGADPGLRARVRFRPESAVDRGDVSDNRFRAGRALCCPELGAGVAEVSAETRPVDGEIQNRNGFPDAGHGHLAAQFHAGLFRQTRLVAGHFFGDSCAGLLGLRRICATGPRASRTGLGGGSSAAGRRLCLGN